jgi:ribosomal protein S18 acetylase RimI-like enzyme
MRVALQDLLAVKDARVWRLSREFLPELGRFYAEVMTKDENRIFVAVDESDRPVGMLMVRILDNPRMDPRPIGRIDDAWVEPQWRAQGVMSALTAACCEFLAGRQVPLVMLDWADNNEPSGTCWQRIGFEPLLTMGFSSPADILSRLCNRRTSNDHQPVA